VLFSYQTFPRSVNITLSLTQEPFDPQFNMAIFSIYQTYLALIGLAFGILAVGQALIIYSDLLHDLN